MPFRARAVPTRVLARRVSSSPSARLAGSPRPSPPQCHIQVRGITLSTIPETIFPNITAAWRRSPRSRTRNEDPMSMLRSAADAKSAKRMREAYEAVRGQGGQLAPEILEEVMLVLRSAGPRAAVIMAQVYEDMDVPQQERWSGRVVRDLSKAGKVREAFELARRTETSHSRPSRHPYHHVLHYAVRFEPVLVPEVIRAIRSHPHGLIDKDYAVLLRHLRQQHQRGEIPLDELGSRLEDLTAESSSQKISIGPHGDAELLRLHVLRQNLDPAASLETKLRAIPIEQRTFVVWDALFDARMVMGDREGVIRLVRDMASVQHDPPSGALVWLVQHALDGSEICDASISLADRIVQAIDQVDSETGVDMGQEVWGQCVRRFVLGSTASFLGGQGAATSSSKTVAKEQMDAAVEILGRAKSRGIYPSIAVVRELVPLLCEAGRVASALELHGEFLAAKPPPDLSDPRDRSAIGLTFTMLLTALARSPSPTVLQSAVELLSSMRSLGLDLHATNLASLVILLMRCASDHPTAFNVYAHFHSLNPQALGLSARRDILAGFIDMTLPHSVQAPPDLVFEMVRDLNRLEALPAAYAFSFVLKLYSTKITAVRKDRSIPMDASDPRRQQLRALGQSVEDIARRIRLDPEIDTDMPVLTALMDAYNRLGQVHRAFEVWAQMVERRARSTPVQLAQYAPAISVILDVCAYNGLERRGRKIWAWGQRHGLVSSIKSWEGWLEALCRWGKVDEAVEVVCGPMRDGDEQAIPRAKKETLELVLKFSWTTPEVSRKVIRDKIREAWPDVWDEVKWVVE